MIVILVFCSVVEYDSVTSSRILQGGYSYQHYTDITLIIRPTKKCRYINTINP